MSEETKEAMTNVIEALFNIAGIYPIKVPTRYINGKKVEVTEKEVMQDIAEFAINELSTTEEFGNLVDELFPTQQQQN